MTTSRASNKIRAPEAEGNSEPHAIATNFTIAVLGKAVGVVAGIATTALLTRQLGATDYGYYRAILAYTLVPVALADLGLYAVVLREISKSDDPREILGAAVLLRLIATGTFTLAAAAISLLLPIADVIQRGLFIAAAFYTAYQTSELLVSVFQKHLKQLYQVIAEAIGHLVLLALTVLAVLYGGKTEMMLLVLSLSAVVTTLLMWRWAQQIQSFRLLAKMRLWRRLIAAGLPLAGSHALGLAMLRGDLLVLSLAQQPDAVGMYGVPVKIFEIATTLPYLFAGLMMPRFVRAIQAGDPLRFRQSLEEALIVMAVFGAGIIATFAVFAEEIIVLIAGASFSPASPSLMLLGPAMAMVALAQVYRFALIAIERQRQVLAIDAASAGLAALAYAFLIPPFSFVGAAAGKLVVEAALLTGLIVMARRFDMRPRIAFRVFRCGLAALAGGVAMSALDSATGSWFVAVILGGLLYLLLIPALRVVPLRELRMLSTPLARSSQRRSSDVNST